jgi:hypothetical protein
VRTDISLHVSGEECLLRIILRTLCYDQGSPGVVQISVYVLSAAAVGGGTVELCVSRAKAVLKITVAYLIASTCLLGSPPH